MGPYRGDFGVSGALFGVFWGPKWGVWSPFRGPGGVEPGFEAMLGRY